MLDSLIQGFVALLSIDVFISMMVGIFLAMIVGILPGVGAVTLIILCLPLILGLQPLVALVFLTSIFATCVTGGTLTAVIMGIPGESSNAATLLDGFPMTRRGEGGRALGAALFASMFGGIFSIVLAFLLMPLVVPFVMSFKSADLFFVILLGLCFLAVLTKGSTIKGLISASIGVLLSTVGYQANTAVERFSFGISYLYDGIQIPVMLLGVFALPMIAELASSGQAITAQDLPKGAGYRQMLAGLRDVFRHWWLFIRCSVLGYCVGLIPGIGGETSIWIAYAHAKQTSKSADTFGSGNVEGVIAPESANNAKAGGSIMITLALGIPGSGACVLILAAFVMLGIEPGPKMLIEHTTLSFSLLLMVAISNVFAVLLILSGLPLWLKITRISPVYLFTFLIPILFIGVYVYKNAFIDLVIVFVIAAIALCLWLFDFSMPALILGFVLGGSFEHYLWRSIDLWGPFFFKSPLSIGMLLIVFIVLTKDMWGFLFKKLRTAQG